MMNDPQRPWLENHRDLRDLLPFINSARMESNAVRRCDDLCKAANKAFNVFHAYRRRAGLLDPSDDDGRSDSKAFKAMLLHGMNEAAATTFCRSASVSRFAGLDPQIMDHGKLLKERYDPRNIDPRIRKNASDEHRQLSNAHSRFAADPTSPELREALLKKIAQLIYVVRSNIAHSEKTPCGPDLEKAERDGQVCTVTADVLIDLFELLLDHPSRRLAVYGTLAPGGLNESVLHGVDGSWTEGSICGVLSERDGLPEFRWRFTPGQAPNVAVRVLTSAVLGEHLPRLDHFEGPRYRRIMVPVETDRLLACNIYEAVD